MLKRESKLSPWFWQDWFWQKRYSIEEVLDEEGLTDIFKYITQNSVKEGLVEHPSQWAGLHGYHQLVEDREVSGPWVNRSDLYIARKRDKSLQESEFTSIFPVLLSPPPMWAEMSDSRYREHCEELCQEALPEATCARSAGAIGGRDRRARSAWPVCSVRLSISLASPSAAIGRYVGLNVSTG